MAKNNTPVIIGAALFGILALGLTLFMIMSRGRSSAPPVVGPAPVSTMTKYVAQRDIPPRTQITSDMLQAQDVAKDKLPPGAITDINSVVGHLSNGAVPRGQVITNDIVADQIGRTTPVYFPIDPAMRAVSVYVDTVQNLSGIVDVGDHVDVIVSHKLNIKSDADVTSTTASARTIAQNLLVLASDRSLNVAKPTPTPAPSAPGVPAAAPPPPPAATPAPAKARVMLQAPPDVAERIVAAQESGTIYLTIRNPNAHDSFPMPTAIEYPELIVHKVAPGTNTARSTASGSSNRIVQLPSRSRRGSRSSNGDSSWSDLPRIPPPASGLPPLPVGPGTTPVMAAPPAKEVTVIRGTEKTRVLVPNEGG